MKRVLLIILSHLLLFFIVFAYQAQAHAEEEEWTIDSLETMAYARVSGEVIHGDNLNSGVQYNETHSFFIYQQQPACHRRTCRCT